MTQRLFVMCGLSFSGKPTFARALSGATGWPIISYGELFATLRRPEGVTALAEWQSIVDAMHERTRAELAAGRSVIDRGALRAIAETSGAEMVVLCADTPLDVTEARRRRNLESLERRTTSDAEFECVRSRFEPADEQPLVVRLPPDDDVVARVGALSP